MNEDRHNGTDKLMVVKYRNKWAVYCPRSCTFDLIGAGYKKCREFADRFNAKYTPQVLHADLLGGE